MRRSGWLALAIFGLLATGISPVQSASKDYCECLYSQAYSTSTTNVCTAAEDRGSSCGLNWAPDRADAHESTYFHAPSVTQMAGLVASAADDPQLTWITGPWSEPEYWTQLLDRAASDLGLSDQTTPMQRLGTALSTSAWAEKFPLESFAAALYLMTAGMDAHKVSASVQEEFVRTALKLIAQDEKIFAFGSPISAETDITVDQTMGRVVGFAAAGCLEVRLDLTRTAMMVKTSWSKSESGRCVPQS
jgi:hypothetical protein